MGSKLRYIIVMLMALSLCAPSLSIPTSAEENYHVTLTLESPEPDRRAQFGYFAIDINENYILVGESRADVGELSTAGKAHLFDHDGNHLLSLQAPDPQSVARFGMSVGIKEDKIYIGEVEALVDGKRAAGQAHIFNIDGSHIKTIISPEPAASDYFGRSLALAEDVLVVSAIRADADGLNNAGKVHLFDLEGNHLTTLQSPTPESGAELGMAMAVSNDMIVIFEPGATVEGIAAAGKVQIFDVNGVHLLSLQSPEPQMSGLFGEQVAVDGDVIIVSEMATVDTLNRAGKVYVYDLDGNLLTTIVSPMPEAEAYFGGVVAIREDTIIISEYWADGGSKDEGRVHVFDKEGNLLETIQAPEPTEDVEFGAYIFVSGETIVVYESGTVQGESNAGRVYFFQEGSLAFDLSDMVIEPSSVKIGKMVSVSCEVSNTGTLPGSHIVTLKVNGEVIEEKTVSLGVGNTEPVSFEVTCEEVGTFSVDVNGLTGSYEVKSKPIIPGFSFGSVILGLMVSAIALMLLRRTRLRFG